MNLFRHLVIVLALALGVSPALAQMQGGPMQNGAPLAPSVTGSDTLSGIYFGTNRTGVTGHFESAQKSPGAVPVATICGAQPDAGSSDTAGTITNVGLTTCTITFGTAYTAIPSCIVLDLTAVRASMVTAVSTTAMVISAITAGDKLAWFCAAKSGG